MIALDGQPPRITPWVVGIVVSAAIHLGAVLILTRVPAPAPVFEPAMMLELAPLTQAPTIPPTPQPADDQALIPPATAQETPPDPAVTPQQAPQTPPPQEQPIRQDEPIPSPPPPDPASSETTGPTPEPAPESTPEPTQELALPDSPTVPEPPVPVPPPRPVVRPAPKPPAASRPVVRTTQPAAEAAAAPAPPTPAPPMAQSSAQATADWRARLLAHLNRFKRYPAMALMRRTQGVAYVHLLLMPDGTARDVRLHASSGAPALDEEALALITRATPMPARPDSGPTELVVPVQFAVR